MSKKNKFKNRVNIVYSTNPDYNYEEDGIEQEALSPKDQNLKVSLDRKKRKGKTVTLVEGFVGNEQDLKDLAKILKQKCGVGGSAKDNEIIIQGDFKEKVKDILLEEGYKAKAI